MNVFYSTSRQNRIDQLMLLQGQTINVQATLDDISDGCGGCERMSYGTHDGKVAWISCLAEDDGRTFYAYLVVDDYKPLGVVERVTWGTSPMYSDVASDSAERYAEMLTMFVDDEIEE